VKQFGCSKSGWSTWEFHWRAFMVANDKRYKEFLEKLDGETLDQLDVAKNATMSVDDVDWEDQSTQLYYMLVLAMPADPAGETIMRNVLHGEGGQAWIRLKGEYAPNEPGNAVARLRQLMSAQIAANADVANETEKLDLEISKYGKAAEEQLSDNIKEGILLGKHVFRDLRDPATYLDVKNEVLSALMAQRSFDDDSMEIGAPKGKPKGKGRGKGDKDKDNHTNKNKFEPKAKGSPNHLRKWCSHCEKPNHVKDDCRKFKRENEAEAEAEQKAEGEKKQRRAMAAALAAGGGVLPTGLPPKPGCDGAGWHSQRLARRAVCRGPQLPVPKSSGSASTASAIPTVPTGMRGINGPLAEQGAIKPRCIFALSVEHSRPRARSAEPGGSMRSASGDSVCVSGIRGVRGIMIDSGAQITAFPCDMLKDKGYVLAKPGISRQRAIDCAEVQRYGKTDVRLKTGQGAIQISAEAADVEFPVMSADAIAKQGSSVFHSPLEDWIVDSPISPPPASANKIMQGKDRGTCYLEHDEMLGGSSEGKRAVRMASVGELGGIIGELGGGVGEQLGDELCPVSMRPKCDDEYPVVEMDFFYVATDAIAGKYPVVNGYVVKAVGFRKLEHRGRGGLPAILSVADCRSSTSGALFGSKHMGGYRAHFVAKLIDSWGRATVILLADGENAIVALAEQAKKLRSHSTIVRQGPAYSSKSMGRIKASNIAAAGLLRTLRFSLETELGCKFELSDSILAFLANAVGWCIARFQPRSHGGSSYKCLFGREYAGEVAEVGEQVWCRIAVRVAAGQGKFEARFAKGIWVGKSEFDDQRLVVDLQRWLLKARSVRRMPEEFRWSAELVKQIDVAPWAPVPERVRSSIRKSMYTAENMLNTRGPTDSCPKCTYERSRRSEQCRRRFETIAHERLEAKLAEEARGRAAPGTPATPGPAPQAPPHVPADAQAAASNPAAAAPSTAPTPVAASATPGMDTSEPRAPARDPIAETSEPNERQRIGALAQAPEVVVIAGLSVCELAVCEEDDDQEEDALWGPTHRAEERCEGLCETQVCRCAYRHDHAGQCACRRCLIGCAKKLDPDAEVVASLCALWSNRRVREQPDWNLDPNSPEPTKCQKGKADELQAMAECGVYRKIRIADCELGGKHVGGFPIAREKAGEVRLRFVATEVARQHRGDNHQGAPPLAMIRAILSLAASRPDSDGQRRRCIRIWDVRKPFFNSDVTENIYVHPGSELCERGYCWELFTALYGARLASQLWGENVKVTSDDSGGMALKCAPGMFYFANLCSDGNDATMGVHGDDFIAEGHVGTLDQLDDVLSVEYEITSSPPLGPGHPGVARYLKRVCGYVDQPPETLLPGFFWHADPKHVAEIIKFGSKEGAEAVDAPGTNAIGAQLRNATDPMPTAEARKTASAGGIALYLAADRPDIMFASKTVVQDVSKPNYQMNARRSRLARYLGGHQVPVWCYELQGLPSIRRADGDADWAAPTAVARKSTSGGAIRFGNHTWECYSASQATQEDARKMVADILTKYVDKETMATHLRELNLRMAGAAMMLSTLLAIPGAAAAKDQCEMDYEGEKLEAVQSRVSPWLLVSLVVVLCIIAYLCGWCVGRLEEQKYITWEVQRLYEVYTVGELWELLVEWGLVLKEGYTRKEELVESAGRNSPTEMQVITQLTNEWKDHGVDVKWRARMRASGRDIQRMLTATAEVMNCLRERLHGS
ncbi:unnamed protein product, partial [Prorocentrum cordatum]